MTDMNDEKSGLSKWLKGKADDLSQGRDVWVWGTGAAAQSFLALTGIVPKGYIESDPLMGKTFNGIKVDPPQVLSKVRDSDAVVFILSMHYAEIEPVLQQHGIMPGEGYHIPAAVAPNRIIVYAQTEGDHRKVVNWLNAEVRYLKLRWFDHYVQPYDDWDILIDTNALQKILDHPLLQGGPSPYAFDIKWSDPIGFIDEFLYYPLGLSKKILAERQWDTRGFYRVSDDMYKLVMTYHCVLQKMQKDTELPDSPSLDCPVNNKFTRQLSALGHENLNMKSLWDSLVDESWLPPVGDIRRWAQVNKSDFLKSMAPKKKGLCVSTIREGGNQSECESALISKAKVYGFRHVGSIILTDSEIRAVASLTRGGCWGESTASRRGGLPSRLIVFILLDDGVLNYEDESDAFNFCIKEYRNLKAAIRDDFKGTNLDATNINWCHGADDHVESIETLNILSADRTREIFEAYDRYIKSC